MMLTALVAVSLAAAVPPYTGPYLSGVEGQSTGYFHVEEHDGTWWLIEPSGRGFYMVGVGHARYSGQGCERLGYSPYEAACERRYGSREAWAEAAMARFESWGFNTLTELHDPVAEHRYAAHTAFQPFGYRFALKDGLPTPDEHAFAIFPNVFSPAWPAHCDAVAAELCAGKVEDPWLVGYFIDNELQWFGMEHRAWGLFNEAWKKPATDPAKEAWVTFLLDRLDGLQDLETHWGVTVDSRDALLHHTSPGPPLTPLARDVCDEWLKIVAERYFSTVHAAIRRHDPNHMILGVRFANAVPDVLDVAARYCDTISVNFYPRFAPGDTLGQTEFELLERWYEAAGKPLLISEWSFPALDSGLPCALGAGTRVETRQQRAECWAAFQEALFRLPFVVGSNYFAWSDEPALGISSQHPENTNYGLLDENDNPYEHVVARARALNPRVEALHRAGGFSPSPPKLPGAGLRDVDIVPNSSTVPLELTAGALRIQGPGEDGKWSVSFHDTWLGWVVPRLQQIGRGYAWRYPSEARVVGSGVHGDFEAIEFEASDQEHDEGAFRARWRLHVPRAKANWFGVECLWAENTGDHPWRLLETQLVMETDIGLDEASDEVSLSDNRWRPFYRNGGFVWDESQAIGLGATFLNPEDFNHYIHAREDGRATGELHHPVARDLAPGERWAPERPVLAFYFLMQHDSPAHFARTVENLLEAIR